VCPGFHSILHRSRRRTPMHPPRMRQGSQRQILLRSVSFASRFSCGSKIDFRYSLTILYRHGGGKRCKADGCNKSAVGGSSLCTAHGGGRRCSVDGCDKSAQSSTKFCVKHGGGKKCCNPDCEKVARGRTQFCAAVSFKFERRKSKIWCRRFD
jgi:hypothetical protein